MLDLLNLPGVKPVDLQSSQGVITITAEVIEYGDPDNTGQDLKGYNQIAYRTEAVLAYAVLDPKAFAVLKSA